MASSNLPREDIVLVGDHSPIVQEILRDALEARGLRVVLLRATGGEEEPTRVVRARCALLTLETPFEDVFDEADVLQVYQPSLKVAFLYGEASHGDIDRARALGPIFRKSDELRAAIAWVVACTGR